MTWGGVQARRWRGWILHSFHLLPGYILVYLHPKCQRACQTLVLTPFVPPESRQGCLFISSLSRSSCPLPLHTTIPPCPLPAMYVASNGKKSELIRLHILSCSLSSSPIFYPPVTSRLAFLRRRLGGRLPSLGKSLSASSLVFLLVNNSEETQKGPEDRTWLHCR